MINDTESRLLGDWEEVFKQGLLTFWVLTALQDAALTVSDVGKEVSRLTKDSYKPAEQTLYRVLRKYHDLKLVNFNEIVGNGGPKKKLYSLTDFGNKMLTDFAKRNIELFQIDKVKNLLDKD